MRFLIVLAVSGWLAVNGCAGQAAALRVEMDGLKARLAELDRAGNSQRQRIAAMDDRILLMQDQIETQRLAVSRVGGVSSQPLVAVAASIPVEKLAASGSVTIRTPQPTSLPLVRLSPTADDESSEDSDDEDSPPYRSKRADRAVATPDKMRDVYSTLDEEGRVNDGRAAPRTAKGIRSSTARPVLREASRSADPSEDAVPLAAYRTAYETYQQGGLDEALTAFRSFVKAWPRHPYSDNAQYWVGECLYDRKLWEEARREFMRVVTEHPDGNKVPDAMVKVGLCAQRMQQPDEARRMYDSVMLTFPDSQAAAVAMRLLGEMP